MPFMWGGRSTITPHPTTIHQTNETLLDAANANPNATIGWLPPGVQNWIAYIVNPAVDSYMYEVYMLGRLALIPVTFWMAGSPMLTRIGTIPVVAALSLLAYMPLYDFLTSLGVDVKSTIVKVLYWLLVASIPPAYIFIQRQKKAIREEKSRRAWLEVLWKTNSWIAFFGFVDLYILGVLPNGPYRTRAHRSLSAWKEKRYLRRLVHMGIMPLSIQEGGEKTYKARAAEGTEDWPYIKLPRYVHSLQRATFEFCVPMGKGYELRQDRWHNQQARPFREFLRRILSIATQYDLLVTISTEHGDLVFVNWSHELSAYKHVREIGKTSWTPWLLPFRSERVLQGPSNGDEQYISDFMRPELVPLLEAHERPKSQKSPIVRIEAMNPRMKRLDAWVYGIAQESGLDRIWDEGVMHAHASKWVHETGTVELPEYVIPKEHRI
jgi:hypothetical protein